MASGNARTAQCTDCNESFEAGSRGPLPLRCSPCRLKHRRELARTARTPEGQEARRQRTQQQKRAQQKKRDDAIGRPFRDALHWASAHGYLEGDAGALRNCLRRRWPALDSDIRLSVAKAYRNAPRGQRRKAGWTCLANSLRCYLGSALEELSLTIHGLPLAYGSEGG